MYPSSAQPPTILIQKTKKGYAQEQPFVEKEKAPEIGSVIS